MNRILLSNYSERPKMLNKGKPRSLWSGLLFIFCTASILLPRQVEAQTPPRFYWKSLSGANAVPVIFQSISGNANPIDPAHVVSVDAKVEAEIAVVGYAKLLPVFDRTLTLAMLVPVGRVSGNATVAGTSYSQSATGFGDPMFELGYNVIGPKAIMNIPDLMRYEPKLSLDVILDVAFPIGEYDNEQSLNLGQNRWYGRIGTPLIWQIGPWVPGRRTTLEVLPSVWWFGDNNDFMGQRLKTDLMFQLEGHLTRDFTEDFWGSIDGSWLQGGRSSIDGTGGESLNNLGVGFTLGYNINDNIQMTAGYMSTVNDSGPTDLSMDGFRISFTYGWHKLIEGMNRLQGE